MSIPFSKIGRSFCKSAAYSACSAPTSGCALGGSITGYCAAKKPNSTQPTWVAIAKRSSQGRPRSKARASTGTNTVAAAIAPSANVFQAPL